MADFADLVSTVAAHVPGCPDQVIEDAVREGAIECCRRTRLWKYRNEVAIRNGVWAYALPKRNATDAISLLTAHLNNSPYKMQPIDPEDLRRYVPNFRELGANAEPRYISQDSIDTFFVAPVPDKSYSVHMLVALAPASNAESMDDAVFRRLRKAMEHRALQELMIQPNMPWQDLEMASYHAKQFIYQVNDARAESNMSVSGKPLRAASAVFAGGRRY